MSECTVVVEKVGKKYRRRDPNRPRTLQAYVSQGLRGGWVDDTFWALEDVSFQVKPGEMLGVIGRNGAGKSTLLRLVGGVGRPDRGVIDTVGRIGALVDLGAGFHPDLTGRENIFLNGVVAGLTRRDVGRRFDEIVAFAELSSFIDSPLRTYSTGMQMRLAFSAAAHTDPEILLIDEVLAVGDMAFQQKCLDRIALFKEQGCAILFVSHDISLVRRICDRALWLERGEVRALGPAARAVDQYANAIHEETVRRTPAASTEVVPSGDRAAPLAEGRIGSLEMEITSVHLHSSVERDISTLCSGEALAVEISYYAPQRILTPIFGVSITQDEERVLYDTSTESAGLILPDLEGRGSVLLHLERFDAGPGSYDLDVGVYQKDWSYAYDYQPKARSFRVEATPGEKGLLRPPHRWEFRPGEDG